RATGGRPGHRGLGGPVKVLVAGASGFVGRRLCAALDRAGHDVVAMTRNPACEHKAPTGAIAFGEAAARAGLHRIIYLGGLGDDADNLSAHLRSRREVEHLLGLGGVPVTVIRAGIIIGNAGLWRERPRQLVEHLPVMITPQWVAPRTQPIAVDDVVTYLAGVLERPEASGRGYEGGGPD